jgi:hypothetical protein
MTEQHERSNGPQERSKEERLEARRLLNAAIARKGDELNSLMMQLKSLDFEDERSGERPKSVKTPKGRDLKFGRGDRVLITRNDKWGGRRATLDRPRGDDSWYMHVDQAKGENGRSYIWKMKKHLRVLPQTDKL